MNVKIFIQIREIQLSIDRFRSCCIKKLLSKLKRAEIASNEQLTELGVAEGDKHRRFSSRKMSPKQDF